MSKEEQPKQSDAPSKNWLLREVIEKPFRIVGTIGIVVGVIGLLGTLQETNPSEFHTSTPAEIRALSALAIGTLVLVFSEQGNGNTRNKSSN